MAQPVVELRLSDYVAILDRRKVIIIGSTLFILSLAILLSILETPKYRAETKVRVDVDAADVILGDSGTQASSSNRERDLQNEVEFARSDRVTRTAQDQLESDDEVTIKSSSEADILTFTAVATKPERSAEIANIFARSYVSESAQASTEAFEAARSAISSRIGEISTRRSSLQDSLNVSNSDSASVVIELDSLDTEETNLRARLNELDVLSRSSQGLSVSILNEAETPSSAFSPAWTRNIILALVIGMLLGILGALVRETLDETIHSRLELEDATDGLPVLTVVPVSRALTSGRKLVTTNTGGFTESFRGLRSAIELGTSPRLAIDSLAITSSSSGEGKSMVAAHTALSYARAGFHVAVLDCDLYSPAQHEYYGLPNESGLADQLAELSDAEIQVGHSTLEGQVSLIPAGTSEESPAELLASPSLLDLIDKLKSSFDMVIIDTAPLLSAVASVGIAAHADGAIFVSKRGLTNKANVEESMELLTRAHCNIIGTVLNNVENIDSRYAYGATQTKDRL